MSKEKMKSLLKHQANVKSLMGSAVPPKHQRRPKQYQAYLQKELNDVTAKIEQLKLEVPNGTASNSVR